jgi:hypothetical protein
MGDESSSDSDGSNWTVAALHACSVYKDALDLTWMTNPNLTLLMNASVVVVSSCNLCFCTADQL